MFRRFPKLAIVTLGMLGFVLQVAFAGVPAGQFLCVGCDAGGGVWSVGHADSTAGAPDDCCGDSHHPDTWARTPEAAPAPDAAATHTTRDCSCIDLPLPHGTGFAANVRSVGPTDELAKAAALGACIPATFQACAPDTVRSARAGPSPPSRLLAPMSRRTVLVL